jgi:hypothetical protein
MPAKKIAIVLVLDGARKVRQIKVPKFLLILVFPMIFIIGLSLRGSFATTIHQKRVSTSRTASKSKQRAKGSARNPSPEGGNDQQQGR